MRFTIPLVVGLLALTMLSRPMAADENQERAALKEKAEAHMRESRALKEAGKHEAAQEHFEKAQALIRELKGQAQREKHEALERQRAAVEEEAAHLKRHLAELKEAGKLDEAAKVEGELKRRLAAMREGIQQREGERREGERREGSPGDQQRVRHVREAAEHLHAAGLHDLAEEVLRHAGGERPRDGRRPPVQRGEGPREEGRPEVRELREQVRHLHEQMEEIRQVLRRMAERKD